MEQKRVFQLILAVLAIMLLTLPLTLSFNDILTRAVQKIGFYVWIQDKIVPWEVKMVGVAVKSLGIKFIAHPKGFTVNNIYAELSWNCLGWQSLLLFLISLPFGFKAGDYTLLSKAKAFSIGLIGTFFVNLLRITFTVILLVISRPLFALVFHDYLAAFVTIIWLVGFWWFSYAFVLEEKQSN